ncbi:cold-shock protein [Weissella sagaensis]|jgi:CspA family cold shock protein|uniref:Cold-shock protein n=1 Tax=Weissella sagaensis TaxID=2559928 RepID=A0ABW1RT12_9LACO|nr:cold shock domain-containing protein [Weissella sagaensis]KAA8433082.1 cold-shock protein [Weissella paramesenteroides]MBU7568256.1 cold-shock protein [Weissella hellenica]KAA8438026.1 cold-shock protein [Weissella paramesenteroides]QDJ59207.1 cold-shock protein [Weissella hellenica]QEA56500.1 cold-shock protein [Weissella hellenica]
MEKISGFVKTWQADKGFGFIELKGEDDVFVHFSAIQTPRVRDLIVGQEVKLVVIQGIRGPQAAAVEVVE